MKLFIEYNISNDEIAVFSSTRALGKVKSPRKIHWKNIEKILLAKGFSLNQLVLPEQVHGSEIGLVEDTKDQFIKGKDALVTSRKSVLLGVATADCVPLVLYDPVKKIIGIAHVGYKGALAGIVNKFIEAFLKIGSSVKDLMVVIGPSICAACYEVKEDVLIKFQKAFPSQNSYFKKSGTGYLLDLKKLITKMLLKAGIIEKNIEINGLCTKENRSFLYSARGSRTNNYGEFITIAGII